MNGLMEDILKIDKISHERILSAKRESADILSDLDTQKKSIISQMELDAKKRLTDVKNFEEANYNSELEELNQEYENMSKCIKENYDKNLDKWVEKIVKCVMSA